MFAPVKEESLLISQGIKEQVVVSKKKKKFHITWSITDKELDSRIKVSLLYV